MEGGDVGGPLGPEFSARHVTAWGGFGPVVGQYKYPCGKRNNSLTEALRSRKYARCMTPLRPSKKDQVASSAGSPELSPREEQTLSFLKAAYCEKEIAVALGLKRNTVHAYVKGIYKRFGVHSRAELLVRVLGDERHDRPIYRRDGSQLNGGSSG